MSPPVRRLHDLARITRGDGCSIHSDRRGGTGGDSDSPCRAGAKIFATAGSSQRRALLQDMGIEHVYDSRSIEFAEQIRRDTDGYGVDIVLNSLTGAAQGAGLELMAVGGRFIEIGKRDVYGRSRLDLYPFRRNLAFHYLDVSLMCGSHPQQIQELLRTGVRLVANGVLPPPKHTALPACRRGHRDPGDERGRTHRQTHPRHPAHGAPSAWCCPRNRLRSSVATVPTSSPEAWVAWGCSSPRRWLKPAAGGSCSPPARSRIKRR